MTKPWLKQVTQIKRMIVMTNYGKMAAWKELGKISLFYGFLTFAVVVLLASFLDLTTPYHTLDFGDYTPEYILLSSLAAFGFFAYRSMSNDMPSTSMRGEFCIICLAAIGLAPIAAFAGLILTAVTGAEYEGAERWLPNVKDRGVYEISLIQKLVGELELSREVQERSEEILEELRNQELMAARNATDMIAAVVYIAARENDTPRSLDEISSVSRSASRDIGKAYRFIARNTDIQVVPPDPEEYLDWFAEKLGLTEDIKERAGSLIDRGREENIFSGKSPTGLAASAIYLSAYMEGERRSMNEVSDLLDVTTVTIRERSKDFVEALDLDDDQVPEHLLEE